MGGLGVSAQMTNPSAPPPRNASNKMPALAFLDSAFHFCITDGVFFTSGFDEWTVIEPQDKRGGLDQFVWMVIVL